jgi:pimeloyl-ACP methyl ester carboxylesterase
VEYDEFGMLADNASEAGLVFEAAAIERRSVEVAPGLRVSALVWGRDSPQLVFVHGGAQNAHTWDTVALALGVPLVAVDLLGHGHSDWRADQAYDPRSHAEAVAVAIRELAPDAEAVVGMSLGGMTTICLAARHPDLVRKAVIVDVTPGVDAKKAAAIIDFVAGPERFASFEELLARTIAHNPTRSEASLRRGVLHNARPEPDGSWVWRYDRAHQPRDPAEVQVDHSFLWEDVSAMPCPALLVRGSLSPVVGDEDVEEWFRRRPDDQLVVVEGAGHSVQGDRPLELADHIRRFVFG